MQKRLIYIILFIIISFTITGQNYINGHVFDSKTHEPIAFANVYIPNTTIGTTTNFDGVFTLLLNDKYDVLEVSSLGYTKQSKEIKNSNSQEIDFYLSPTSFNLMEVIIKPGENPAITLLKKVWKNKAINSADNLDQYSVETYTKAQVYIRPSDDKNEKSKSFSKYTIISDEDEKPIMPVYMSQTVATDFHKRLPKYIKSEVIATKTNSLLDDDAEMLTQLLQKNNKIDFYQNNIKILDKHFVSPISNTGLFYYKYYLEDSIYIDDFYCYRVKYVPKREEDLAFSGTFWINDSTFALKRITAELGKNANLNFIDRIKIEQDLVLSSNKSWYASDTKIMADAMNVFINLSQSQSKFEITNYPNSFFIEQTTSLVTPKSSELYFENKDYDEIDLISLQHINSLKDDNYIKFLSSMTNMLVKGYWNLGKIEVGPYLSVYSKNSVEGHRVRLGYKTNNKFSEKWINKVHLAYGFKDEKVKYSFQLERFISRKSWTKVGVQIADDVQRMGAIDEFYHPNSFFSFTSSFGKTNLLQATKTYRMWWEGDIFNGLNQKIIFVNKSHNPLSPEYIFGYYTNDNSIKSKFTISEINFITTFQPGVSMIIDKNERIPVSFNKNPTITLSYSLGIKNLFNSDFNYHKASLGFRQDLLLGSIGRINYNLKFQKAFSPLPYPLLTSFDANESFFKAANTYNLMRHNEFVTDESVELFLTFRQDGLILDKIPLIKKLKWRTITSANIAYGGFDKKKNGFFDKTSNPKGILASKLPDGKETNIFNTFDKNIPYIELSYGIENIFNFFRIESIHRLTYRDVIKNQNKAKDWGIKFSATFRF